MVEEVRIKQASIENASELITITIADLQSLAVSDLATLDAIQLAKEVDLKALRPLGVVTKIDLMDQGAHALKILYGNIIPFQLGYIGAVNRLQKDINNNKAICNAQQSE
eukprot:220839_1